MSKRISFIVSVDLPNGCSVAEMRQYIKSWVQSGKGCLDPWTNPLAHLDPESVTVRSHRELEGAQ